MMIWESLKIIGLWFGRGEVQRVGRIGDLSLSDVTTQNRIHQNQRAGHARVRRGWVIFATCGFRLWSTFPLKDPSYE